MIYHMAPAERWAAWPTSAPYPPAEFEHDGFIHCTAGDDILLLVANRFYREVPGDFVLLVIDERDVQAPLRWEYPVDNPATLFPHIYGPINQSAIVAVRTMQRTPAGTFEGWQ